MVDGGGGWRGSNHFNGSLKTPLYILFAVPYIIQLGTYFICHPHSPWNQNQSAIHPFTPTPALPQYSYYQHPPPRRHHHLYYYHPNFHNNQNQPQKLSPYAVVIILSLGCGPAAKATSHWVAGLVGVNQGQASRLKRIHRVGLRNFPNRPSHWISSEGEKGCQQ